jgi:lactate dehydrogenase-like 2-hydroxyacid dehydrogenase
MTDKQVILAHPGLGGLMAIFEGQYEVVTWPKTPEAMALFLAETAPRVRAAVVIGSTGLPAEAYDALPNLGAIVCFGAGTDGVRMDQCRARGIALGNCPGANADDVADFAMGLLIDVERRISAGGALMREGLWKGIPAFPTPPRGLRGLKLGVVGLGAIGLGVARRGEAFGMNPRWTGPRPKADAPYPFEANLLSLAQWADVLVLALRPDPGTEQMVNAEVLGALGPEGVLINVARGSVVDEDALIAALKDGRLAGAGLDVFEAEPTPMERWAGVPNVVLTPHIAGASRQSVVTMAQMVLANLAAHFAGQPMPTPVAVV